MLAKPGSEPKVVKPACVRAGEYELFCHDMLFVGGTFGEQPVRPIRARHSREALARVIIHSVERHAHWRGCSGGVGRGGREGGGGEGSEDGEELHRDERVAEVW